ncbi:MAG: DUF1553 domain-containing protein [Planctomycetes bacterium]|nr:DUF1553 domain-containing protein [Planctomycetota bacterium]
MRFDRCGFLIALLFATWPLAGGRLEAADLLPPETSIADAVDFYVEAVQRESQVTPAPEVDDANFIRRVTLDLAGRIPSVAEVRDYVQSTEPQKKQQLVDRLLASPDFPYHQRNEVDALLMAGKGPGEWRDWLYKAYSEDRRWPDLFRSLMLPKEADAVEKPAVTYLKTRAANIDDMTNDTSRLFFGVSINCAKCHDHPLVADWKQDHYFGMASFFNRTYLTKKQFLAERDEGQLKFRTKAGEEKQARLLFLTSADISEPSLAEKSDAERQKVDEKQKADNDRETPPEPAFFSRRAQLVDVALRPDSNSFFTRSFVNRNFARIFGRGLVTPLDQMHSENEPSHPELLQWLARDVESHGYDVRRLLRGLVLSRAYGRSSRWEQAGDRPADRLFAVAAVRPLTPMQFALSLAIATGNPADLAGQQAAADQWPNRRRDLENQAYGFAQQLELPGENFQVGVSEALLFANGGQIANEYLRDSGDRLVGVLKGQSDRNEMIKTAFLSVLSREPQSEELAAVSQYLAEREDRSAAAISQFVWSLLTSSEFRFNY